MPALAGIRLIALTGYGQEADRRRGREAGFDEHLVKPVRGYWRRRSGGRVSRLITPLGVDSPGCPPHNRVPYPSRKGPNGSA